MDFNGPSCKSTTVKLLESFEVHSQWHGVSFFNQTVAPPHNDRPSFPQPD